MRLPSGEVVSLQPRHIVGRSPACSTRLADAAVSSEHLVIAWDGATWAVRDLGSRNGTAVDGAALRGEVPLPRGATVRVADAVDLVLVDDGPPVASATSTSGDTVRGSASALCLPDLDQPAASVVLDEDGSWWIETAAARLPVRDRETVLVEGVAWTLDLPTPVSPTVGRAAPPRLLFRVSADEEQVALEIEAEGHRLVLPARSHHYLLLTLARVRLRDGDLPLTDRGWWTRDALARDLRCERRTVDVQLHRVRGDLGRIRGGTSVVEVRARTGQVRVGTDQIEIIRG